MFSVSQYIIIYWRRCNDLLAISANNGYLGIINKARSRAGKAAPPTYGSIAPRINFK